MRSTPAIASVLFLAGCLSTPTAQPSPDGAPPIDAPPPDAAPPDAYDPCANGGCDQLLAVAMSGWAGPAGGGWVILRHDGEGGWDEVAESSGPDWDVYDVELGDCCGPSGPDGVPDLLGAAWSGPHVSVLATGGGTLRAGIPRPVDEAIAEDPAAQAIWFDVDGDLDLDVLTGRDSLHAYVHDGGDWTFTDLYPGWNDHWLAPGNWDDDAALELAAAGGAGVHVFDGSWTAPVDVDPRSALDVAWCDVAGSPHPELFAQRAAQAKGISNPIDLYPNLGFEGADDWFDDPLELQTVTGRSSMQGACVDLDGDGGLDFLFLTYEGIKVRPHGVAGTSVVWTTLDRVITDFEVSYAGGEPTGLFVVMNDPPADGILTEVIWLPNQSAGGTFAVGAPQPIYDADVAGWGLAWIEVPAGVLPDPVR